MTNRQYELFLGQHPGIVEPRYWRERKYNQPEQPVVGVSWLEARAFCWWLSKISGQRMDLPTEAQWEFAARGEEGRKYPWGAKEPDETRAYYGKNWATVGAMPVGSLPAGRGPFGHLELAGNVWEWCREAWDHQAYKRRGQLTVNPKGLDAADNDPGVARACRGSAFFVGPKYLRSACRFQARAGGGGLGLGFRVAALRTSR